MEDITAMAGACLYHLCKSHCFVDGNKRVALAVASGQMEKDEITAYLRDALRSS